MMYRFRDTLKNLSNYKQSKLILALDPDPFIINYDKLLDYAKNIIETIHEDIISIKFNMHILLPLNKDDLRSITSLAHKYKLLTIADIKLSDIPSTNQVAIYNLACMGFDAFIINPCIGFYALSETFNYALSSNIGMIALIFMSHKGADETFGLKLNDKRLYEMFLEWSLKLDLDGIVVGATYPYIIRECYNKLNGKIPIFSPGISIQGGNPLEIKDYVDYIIVGRKILGAKDPLKVTRELKKITWRL